MNYFKKVWQAAGSLKLVQYFTGATIIWTVLLIVMIFGMFSETIKNDFSLENLLFSLEILLIEIFFTFIILIFWYVCARFNPFCFESFKIHFKNDLKQAVQNSKAVYRNEKAKGPITTEEKIDPLGGDYTGSYTGAGGTYLKNVGSKENPEYAGPTVVHGKINLNYNWTSHTESSFDVVSRAFSEGLKEGLIRLTETFLVKPCSSFMFWPLSCIVGWFTIGKYVEQYSLQEYKEQINKNNTTSRFDD